MHQNMSSGQDILYLFLPYILWYIDYLTLLPLYFPDAPMRYQGLFGYVRSRRFTGSAAGFREFASNEHVR
jgi:hypothetical protein